MSERAQSTGCPAFVPYQLSDEMYSNIYRNAELFGYPTLEAGSVKQPKYGYLFLEAREPGSRRPKLVDGLDWVPSSSANASSRVLKDGVTELVRNYCARRTKAEIARPQVRPFLTFQRAVHDEVKAEHPEANTYEIKALIGQRWRSLPDSEKQPYKELATQTNRLLRQRMASADPKQLIVRHEMWVQPIEAGQEAGEGQASKPAHVLVHYLGDDAFQCLTIPPQPVFIMQESSYSDDDSDGEAAGGAGRSSHAQLQLPADVLHHSDETANVQICLDCYVVPTGSDDASIAGGSCLDDSSCSMTGAPTSSQSHGARDDLLEMQQIDELLHEALCDDEDHPTASGQEKKARSRRRSRDTSKAVTEGTIMGLDQEELCTLVALAEDDAACPEEATARRAPQPAARRRPTAARYRRPGPSTQGGRSKRAVPKQAAEGGDGIPRELASGESPLETITGTGLDHKGLQELQALFTQAGDCLEDQVMPPDESDWNECLDFALGSFE